MRRPLTHVAVRRRAARAATPDREQGSSTLVAIDGNGQACLFQPFPAA